MEHMTSGYDPIGNHFTYETNEEAYLIATTPIYGIGVYVNEHNPSEYFIKAILKDGQYAVGFSLMNSSDKTLFKATNDGGMLKDDDTWVSNNEAEAYLVNADQAGFIPFELINTEYDWEINVTLWYRQVAPVQPIVAKKVRKPRRKSIK